MPDPAEEQLWSTDHTYQMLSLCDDDVAAYLIACKAYYPNELRALAGAVGLDHGVGSLRELTVQVVVQVRGLNAEAELNLRRFALVAARDPRQAAADYHARVI